jgi:16S rRNA (uracil1498-N3)-methyltransferase
MSGRVRLSIDGLEPGARVLDPQASRYLAVVLRLRAEDAFVAFDPRRGVEAEGRVVRVHRGKVHVELGPVRPGVTVAPLSITWIQGLAKGEKMDAVVRDATELGATRFVPAETQFSVVRLDGPRSEARRARWARIADEAGRQCGRADPPLIDGPRPWDEALAAAGETTARFCLYERAKAPLGPALWRALGAGAPLAFAVGPEGGLSEGEVAAARAAGFEVVSLGDLILRTETVVAAVLGATRIFLQSPAVESPALSR